MIPITILQLSFNQHMQSRALMVTYTRGRLSFLLRSPQTVLNKFGLMHQTLTFNPASTCSRPVTRSYHTHLMILDAKSRYLRHASDSTSSFPEPCICSQTISTTFTMKTEAWTFSARFSSVIRGRPLAFYIGACQVSELRGETCSGTRSRASGATLLESWSTLEFAINGRVLNPSTDTFFIMLWKWIAMTLSMTY